MHGQNRQLITIQCCVCKTWVALRLDKDDLARHLNDGVLVQDALPYLSAGDRELVYSRLCESCYALLCPSSKLAYS
ncbi:MAG: hypothetical protein LAO56_23395 [Acidobacteriia bacterium]|nr:hypothetical protein [Terriglobia bacterium]